MVKGKNSKDTNLFANKEGYGKGNRFKTKFLKYQKLA